MPTVYSKFLLPSDDPDGHIPGLRMQKNPRVKLQPPSMRTRNLLDLDNYEDVASYVLPKVLSREELRENYEHEKREGHFSTQLDSARRCVYKEYNLHSYSLTVEHEDPTLNNKNVGFKPLHEMDDLDNDIADIDAKINDLINDLSNKHITGLEYHQENIEVVNKKILQLEEETSVSIQNGVEGVQSFVEDGLANVGIDVYNMQERMYGSLRDRLNRVTRLCNQADSKQMKKIDQLRSYIVDLEHHLQTVKAQFINTLHISNKQPPTNPALQYPPVFTQVYMSPNAGQIIIPAYYAQDYQIPCVNQQPISNEGSSNQHGAQRVENGDNPNIHHQQTEYTQSGSELSNEEHSVVITCNEGMPEADVEVQQQRNDIDQCVSDPPTANKREHFHADDKSQTLEDQESSKDFDKDNLPNAEHPPAVSSEAKLQNADDATQVDKNMINGSLDENDEALPSNEEAEFMLEEPENQIQVADEVVDDESRDIEEQVEDVLNSEDNSAENDTDDETGKSGWFGRLIGKGKKSKSSKKKKNAKKEKKAKKDEKNNKNDGELELVESGESAEEGDKKDKNEKENENEKKDKKTNKKKDKESKRCFFPNLFFSCFGGKKLKRNSIDESDVEDNVNEIEQTTSEEIVNSNATIINVKPKVEEPSEPTAGSSKEGQSWIPTSHEVETSKPTLRTTNKRLPAKRLPAVKLSPNVVSLLAELAKPASQPPVEKISASVLKDSCWDN